MTVSIHTVKNATIDQTYRFRCGRVVTGILVEKINHGYRSHGPQRPRPEVLSLRQMR